VETDREGSSILPCTEDGSASRASLDLLQMQRKYSRSRSSVPSNESTNFAGELGLRKFQLDELILSFEFRLHSKQLA
jgi:hypothetical protein